jgi:hypothetical protein
MFRRQKPGVDHYKARHPYAIENNNKANVMAYTAKPAIDRIAAIKGAVMAVERTLVGAPLDDQCAAARVIHSMSAPMPRLVSIADQLESKGAELYSLEESRVKKGTWGDSSRILALGAGVSEFLAYSVGEAVIIGALGLVLLEESSRANRHLIDLDAQINSLQFDIRDYASQALGSVEL